MIGQSNNHFQASIDTDQDSFDLTALMDVIFILLIFFILTSGISQISTEINLPQSKELLKSQVTEEVPVIIEMYDKDRRWKVNDDEIRDYKVLKEKLLSLHLENKERLFVIAPEKTLPSEILVQLLNFFSLNGISHLQIVSEWTP